MSPLVIDESLQMLTTLLRSETPLARHKHLRTRASEPPLRAELFGVEQLARHAQAIAAQHQLVVGKGSYRLLARLDHNEKVLRAFNRASLAADKTRRVTPAAEWLLDNFYLIEEQIQLARRHLPREYSRELSRLTSGPSAGFLRVYDIVLELLAHVDAQIDADSLSAFVAAYQTVAPLKLGELWAVPIMLRLGLIENLARITTGLAQGRRDRDLANQWVERLQAMAEKNPSRIVIVVADMARADPSLSSAFVAEFCQRLSRLNPVLHLARGWLEQRTLEQGSSVEQLIHQESQNQASDQVSVSHSISSLRLLSAIDWKEFVETLSLVEQTLRGEPADVYGDMDFATRDRYRHVVETLARYSALSEMEAARKAVELAQESAQQKGREARTAHVGFYLIDKGLRRLERAVGARWRWKGFVARSIQKFPFTFYVGGISLFTLLATLGFVHAAEARGGAGWQLAFCAFTFLLGVSQLAVALWNWLATLLLKPQLLPRLGYSPGGIAPESRGMVVVPTILTSAENIDNLLQTLEIHHLANRDPHLHFAILTDWPDAAEENLLEDAPLLERAKGGIESLNRKYGRRDLFFLFHRPRRWNASEGVWMGYERKRGKLMQFNVFLRGRCAECFTVVIGDQSILREIRYVITLDTDTQLPREAARQLIGTMAHPLNRPQFDPARGIVIEGYSLLQPRVDVSLLTADRSRFVRLHAGDVGIDPYTRTVSDVYQDLFGEGSFIGKGVYDVDAFERALAGRFPENRILSHDLLESVYARCGLVSDVKFYEEYPSRYEIDAVRRHRWIRGDWQILPWLLPRVPDVEGRRIRNPISALSWWKIFDNLRRSLVPIALVFFFLAGWLLVPRLGLLATCELLAIIALPGLLSLGVELLRKPEQLPWLMHLRGTQVSAKRTLSQTGLALAFLPNDAFLSLTAIGVTLWRVFTTRRHLLEWVTSGEVARSARTDLAGSYGAMWFATAIALGGAISLGLMQPARWMVALPFFALWLTAPWIAWWISLPIEQPTPELSVEQLTLLRRIARKTWHFFETFVTAEENWLPPDNFQEEPTPAVAARTSPTNIGLSLLANLAAHDFGYLSLGRLLERTQATIDTLHRLERHRGHFYNWYETRTLRPLIPLYISSVDSGNLAGHLLTLSCGLRGLAEEKILDPQIFLGLRDTLALVKRLTGENPLISQLDAELAQTPSDLRAAATLLQRAVEQSEKISSALANREGNLTACAQTLQRSCAEHLDELNFHAPWLTDENLTSKIAQVHAAPSLREIATFDQLDGQFPVRSELLGEASKRARERLRALETLASQCDELAGMDFSFLFDKARNLFAIGFNVTEGRRDLSFYDLLASEVRLCSYLAIAEGQVPQEHWFALGRLLVAPSGEPILVSWSGSMFEYLMPLLVMPNYRGTLLDRACKTAVELQIEYGNSRGVPWGVSESGFNQGDVKQTYQYRAFGVPGLGLKRGLAEDLVIAPYATVLALMVAPREASENLQRLAGDGREGDFGFYEAVDYTPSRLPPDESSATVRSYMAHHQGMSLLALVSSLRDLPMQRRFMSRPLLKAADLLLQERLPKTEASVLPEDLELEETRPRFGEGEDVMRVFKSPTSRTPEIHLLSNGRYHVAISNAGGGYSRWKDLAITRWREDATCDYWGAFIYLRDVTTGEFWSAAYQPTLRAT